MAKDRRCLDGQSWEVAAMASAETVMAIYSDRGKRGLPLEGVYRQLYSRDLYLRAYGRIHRNNGAMTPGVIAETVDAMSLEKIDGIISVLRREAYRWSPARRMHIPKKNGKKRPLGLPMWSDKLVQEAIRLLLDAYYGPRSTRLTRRRIRSRCKDQSTADI